MSPLSWMPKRTREIDATGRLASPPFVDSHFHLDSTLTYGRPRVNASGTLLEGIELWGELKPDLTVDEIKARAIKLCHWSIAHGTLAIRSHVDVSDDRLLAVKALLEVRAEIKPYIDLQLVAFPQDGYLRYPGSTDNLKRALDLGCRCDWRDPPFRENHGGRGCFSQSPVRTGGRTWPAGGHALR